MKTQEDYYQEYVEEVNGVKSFMVFLYDCVMTPPENEMQALARKEFAINWSGHFEELAHRADTIFKEQRRGQQ